MVAAACNSSHLPQAASRQVLRTQDSHAHEVIHGSSTTSCMNNIKMIGRPHPAGYLRHYKLCLCWESTPADQWSFVCLQYCCLQQLVPLYCPEHLPLASSCLPSQVQARLLLDPGLVAGYVCFGGRIKPARKICCNRQEPCFCLSVSLLCQGDVGGCALTLVRSSLAAHPRNPPSEHCHP